MSAGLIQSVYSAAATIAKPLSLSAFIVSSLTLIIRQAIVSLEVPLKKASSEAAVDIVKTAITYLFVLAVIGLIGGITSYTLEFFLEDYVKKFALLQEAQNAQNRQDPKGIMRYAAQIIKQYPKDAEGYHFKGIGEFYAKDYKNAAVSFESALIRLPSSNEKCEEKRRSFVFDRAAAQAAAEQYSASLASMRSLKECWTEKTELLNLAKIEVMNKEYDDAEKILNSAAINDGRPDFKSRIELELAFLSILRKEKDWEESSINHFSKAISHDASYGQLVLCSDTSSKLDPPGMIGEYKFELAALANPGNSAFVGKMRTQLHDTTKC